MSSFLVAGMMVLMPFLLRAENSAFVTLWNQVSQGVQCHSLDPKELLCSEFALHQSNLEMIQKMKLPTEAIDVLTFREATRQQIQKDECLIQMVDAVIKNPKTFHRWKNALYLSWLGKRKAELMYQICLPATDSLGGIGKPGQPIPPIQYKGKETRDASKESGRRNDLSVKREILKARNESSQLTNEEIKKWQPLCSDPQVMAALAVAGSIYSYAVPLVNSPEIFKLMERHRDMIVDVRTQKPLTDAQILRMNLNDVKTIENVRFDVSMGESGAPSKSEVSWAKSSNQVLRKSSEASSNLARNEATFETVEQIRQTIVDEIPQKMAQEKERKVLAFRRDLQSALDQLLQPKKKMVVDLKGISKNFNGLYVPTQARDYLYQEGTLEEVAVKAFPPEKGSAAACLLSRYQANGTAEMAQFALESAFGGVAIMNLLRRAPAATAFTKELNQLSRFKRFQASTQMAGTVIGSQQMGNELYRNCISAWDRTPKMKDSDLQKNRPQQGEDLPKEFGFRIWPLEKKGENNIDPRSVPSCRADAAVNFIQNLDYQTNCVEQSLKNLLPLSVELTVEDLKSDPW